MDSEFFQLCTFQEDTFKPQLSAPSLPLTHGTWPMATHTGTLLGHLDVTDPAVRPQTQDLMHKGQNWRQHRAVPPAPEWRHLGSNPISPPPTSSATLHKLFKFIMATYLHLLNQGKCFWTQSCHEMMYKMHLAQCQPQKVP